MKIRATDTDSETRRHIFSCGIDKQEETICYIIMDTTILKAYIKLNHSKITYMCIP